MRFLHKSRSFGTHIRNDEPDTCSYPVLYVQGKDIQDRVHGNVPSLDYIQSLADIVVFEC